jgi:hypothetical protein
MNALWDAYWPLLTAAAVIGVIAGVFAFRATTARRPGKPEYRRRAGTAIAAGAAAVLALGWVWHGHAEAAERFALPVERQSRQVLVDFEMAQVHAVLERHPMRRTLVLAGSADDFQRGELVRIMNDVPGVANVRWSDMPAPLQLPLLAEAELAALVSFGVGLLLSYLLELRRRYRAQWSW